MPATGSSGARRRFLPRRSLRLRLTMLYGGLFLAAGAILLAITYALVAHSISSQGEKLQAQVFVKGQAAAIAQTGTFPAPGVLPPAGAVHAVPSAQAGGSPKQSFVLRAYTGRVDQTFKKITAADQKELEKVAREANAKLKHQRTADLDALLTKSGIALAIMAFLSVGLGWLIAGRALRPVRTMSARARGISERNLHERLALDGPEDELKELGETFDELLARLDTAFESQRRFVANASHELRTPITLERTLVEVALADPNASIESFRDTCRRVLAAGEQQERLIEALLTLARSQRGLDSREQLDLGELTRDVIRGIAPNGVRLERELSEAEIAGDPRLIERLIANLLDNALKYNQHDGWVQAWTGIRDGSPTFEVSNSGPVIAPENVEQLLEPFRRLNGDRSAAPEPVGKRGLGLGLSIVDAIAAAHGASMSARPRPEGGLRVEVRFQPRPGPSLN